MPEEDREMSTEWHREDGRWTYHTRRRDWLLLLVMVVLYLVWTGIIFAFEPGIR